VISEIFNIQIFNAQRSSADGSMIQRAVPVVCQVGTLNIENLLTIETFPFIPF